MMNALARIAASLERFDSQAVSVDQAQLFIAQLVASGAVSEHVEVALHDALGRVLARDVVSPRSVPPHDNSAMDGYAFDGSVLAEVGDTCALSVIGTALAGDAWKGDAARGEAVKIMTGAVMPNGLDTVVAQELCTRDGATVRFAADAVRRGDNRRMAGEDLMQGDAALRQGDRLSPAALGLLASLGLAHAPVWRRLRVAYFSTGNEILRDDEAPREGAVYDSNRFTVHGLLTRMGCEVVDIGCVRDDAAALEAALKSAASTADTIITSGGVSVGEADHTRAVMERVGDIAFWQVAMRPGRPMAVGLVPDGDRRAVLFGLPGNPVAVMVAFLVFVRPALLRMMGCNAVHAASAPLMRARSATPIRKKPGRTEYPRGVVSAVPGALPQVQLAGNQGSGVLSSMAQANCLVVLHHAQGAVEAGAEVDVMLLDSAT
jgi:molybdopterin molybdotransferase